MAAWTEPGAAGCRGRGRRSRAQQRAPAADPAAVPGRAADQQGDRRPARQGPGHGLPPRTPAGRARLPGGPARAHRGAGRSRGALPGDQEVLAHPAARTGRAGCWSRRSSPSSPRPTRARSRPPGSGSGSLRRRARSCSRACTRCSRSTRTARRTRMAHRGRSSSPCTRTPSARSRASQVRGSLGLTEPLGPALVELGVGLHERRHVSAQEADPVDVRDLDLGRCCVDEPKVDERAPLLHRAEFGALLGQEVLSFGADHHEDVEPVVSSCGPQ